MRISELAEWAGVSTKAVRYYERLGLITAPRLANGYRDYGSRDVRRVVEIRDLAAVGISASRCRPFLECLNTGHEHSDECPASLAALRDAISEIEQTIATLTQRRVALTRRLRSGADGYHEQGDLHMTDYTILPGNLPVPENDGAADHLPDVQLPSLTLPATDGQNVELSALGSGRTVIYLYPLTGRPGEDLPDGWDSIPGARGCSTEACSFRDHFHELVQAGADRVYGLSSQSTDYQRELVGRLHLPFAMLSDPDFALADALTLPTFSAPGHDRLHARLTLVASGTRIEHVFYPIFPPNTHSEQVLTWLRDH